MEDPWKTLKKIHQRDEEKTKRNAAQALLRLHSSQEKGHCPSLKYWKNSMRLSLLVNPEIYFPLLSLVPKKYT